MIDEVHAGVWIVKAGQFIPESEKWLFVSNVQEDLNEAISWAEENPPRETSLEDLENQGRK
ncbi:conserved hypothetical protein [delta proteobacterium NaphS2]|nr:conserved hypothetical protein [delta proteobacterium NaphS2]